MKSISPSQFDFRRRQCRGLTLVELMVAMSIGLVLISGVIQILSSSKQASRLQDSQARMQENARFIFEVFSHDIRQAGYQGCNSRRPETINNDLNNNSAFAYQLESGLAGYEAISSSWNTTLDPSIHSPLPGNDILIIRGVLDAGVRVISTDAASVSVTTPNTFDEDDIVMLADCTASAIFQITNDNPQSGTLLHDTSPRNPGNASGNLGRKFSQDAQLNKIATSRYYIAAGASGLPALYRKQGNDATEEIVEGVEGMQILYGEDMDSNANVDRFITADQVADMTSVIAVRISILLQSMNDYLSDEKQTYTFNHTEITPDDHKIRRSFSTTITLRNRLP